MDDGSTAMPMAGVMPMTVAAMAMAPMHAPTTPMHATTVATKVEAEVTTATATAAAATHNT